MCLRSLSAHAYNKKNTCFNKHVSMMLHVMSIFTRMPGSFIIIFDDNVKLN